MTQAPPPMFTIVIPTRDRAVLVERAVRGVLAQSESDFELIVVDDGSTDDTEARITAITDPRVRYVAQEPSGAGPARNHGAELGTGRFVTFVDSDDEVLPGWLEQLADVIRDQRCGIVSCGFIDRWPSARGRADELRVPKDLGTLNPGVSAAFWHGGTFVVERALFLDVGGYADTPSRQHTELAYRLVPAAVARGVRFGWIPDALVVYHRGTPGAITRDRRALLDGSLYILEHHQALLRNDPDRRATHQAVAGVRAAQLGEPRLARRMFAASVRSSPRRPIAWGRLALALLPGPVHRKVWLRANS
jgi:glycosyltransferase involved in cell wall biosynthesis